MGQRMNSSTLHMLYFLLAKRSREEAFKLDEFIRTAQTSLMKLDELRAVWLLKHELPMSELVSSPDDSSIERIAKNIIRQKIIFQYDPGWIELFFSAAEQRLQGYQFITMKELLRYLYGAGDVVGMMGAQLLGLPREAQHSAAMQARALHFLDIVADADNNEELFPAEVFEKHGLDNLGRATTEKEKEAFYEFMHAQLKLFNGWQRQANKGLKHVPKGARRVIHALIDSGHMRARQIARDPEVIYNHKLAPSRARVAGMVVARLFD